jgi:hypothetical protein
MRKTAVSLWMALAVPFINGPGNLAPTRNSAAPQTQTGAAEKRTQAPGEEIPLLFRILLTPPPDLRATWPDLETLRREEAFFSVQQ